MQVDLKNVENHFREKSQGFTTEEAESLFISEHRSGSDFKR